MFIWFCRFWIGTWITIILIVMVAIDASAFVCYITRFTEENFATLIAFIFIYKVDQFLLIVTLFFIQNSSFWMSLFSIHRRLKIRGRSKLIFQCSLPMRYTIAFALHHTIEMISLGLNTRRNNAKWVVVAFFDSSEKNKLT